MRRAIAILQTIADTPDGLTLAQLTARLGLPKSSVLGICSTLIEGGLLQRNASGAFRLGVSVVDLAHSYLSMSSATMHFRDAWNACAPSIDETVVLSVLDGLDVVYVACQTGANGLTFNYRIGLRLPANCSASGKALLSTLPDPELDALLAHHRLNRMTANSLCEPAALRRELAATRARGYAIDDEEIRAGMCCVGAPVFDTPDRPAVAAVAVTMLKAAFTDERKDLAIRTVVGLAENLSRRLGGVRALPFASR